MVIEDTSKKEQKQKIIMQIISLVLAFALVCSTLFALFLINKNSVAYLYDEADVKVDYSVAQLSFDVSSNHMYSYYKSSDIYNNKFEKVLSNLNTYIGEIDRGDLTKTEFNTKVRTELAKYYDSSMLSSLNTAYNNATSQDSYDDETRSIYNAYYTKYAYLFKIKNVQLESIDSEKGVWYYYATDLLQTYFKEYVVQEKATGTRQSTMKIGVKLKGGTTYSNDENGEFYDVDFNDMVTAYTMRFNNTGNVSLYLNVDLNLNSIANNSKGIIGLILPYGMDLDELKTDANYSQFYDSDKKIWNYRKLIKAIINNNNDKITASMTGTKADDIVGSLNYASLENVLKDWNEYAISTYKTNSDVNDKKNYVVAPQDTTTTDLKQINMSMLFWADYGQVSKYYKNNTDSLSWKDDTDYMLIPFDYTLDIKTSLKNNDLSTLTPADWEELYNSQTEYEKYVGVSNFEVEGYAYFEKSNGDGTTTIENAKNYMDGGYIICNYVNKSAMNYIGNIRFNVNYRGYSPAYVRVRVIEQFTNNKGEIEAVNPIKFNLDDSWIDNRINDLFLYSTEQFYSTDNNSQTVTGRAKMLSIPIIKGLDASINDASDIDSTLGKNNNFTLKMYFLVEATQPNRIEEYWNLSIDDINNMK